MAETIIFRGARLINFDMRQSQEGAASFVRMHMAAEFSDPVREAMNWDVLPNGYKDAALKGELSGLGMVLNPSQKELKAYAFKLPIKKVSDFKVVSLKQGEDEADEQELRFTILTSVQGAFVSAGNWIENCGKALGQLTVSYEAAQEDLPGVRASAEQRQAVLQEA